MGMGTGSVDHEDGSNPALPAYGRASGQKLIMRISTNYGTYPHTMIITHPVTNTLCTHGIMGSRRMGKGIPPTRTPYCVPHTYTHTCIPIHMHTHTHVCIPYVPWYVPLCDHVSVDLVCM